MAKVEITRSLFEEIEKKFKARATAVFDFIESAETHPRKGKELGTVGAIVIKELRYEGFRFYFITDGYLLRYSAEKELVDLLLKFVRMSVKKHQQKAIEEIKHVLRTIGPSGLK